MGCKRTSGGIRRRHALLVTALVLLVACTEYLTEPGVDAEPRAPVLAGTALTPDSVLLIDADAVVQAVVEGRSDVGIDSVGLVLTSASGAGKVRCVVADPEEGNVFDGRWRCPLVLPPGSESGLWAPDSVALFGAGDPVTTRIWTASELADAGVLPRVRVVGTPPVPTTLDVEPALVVLTTADTTVTLSGVVLNQYGGVMPDVPLTWTSTDDGVATVNAEGVVTPVGLGSAEIVAEAAGLEARASVEVPPTPVLMVSPSLLDFEEVGESASIQATLTDQFGDPVPSSLITFQSENPDVAEVVGPGATVVANGPGSTFIVVRAGDLESRITVTVGGGVLTPGHRWINPEGGSFTDPANWSRGEVPAAQDTAVIDLEGTYQIRLNATAAVGTLLAGNGAGSARPTLALQDGRLAVGDTAHFSTGSTLHIEYGALEGAGTVVVADTLRWSGGLQSGPGRTVVTADGVLLLTGDAKYGDGRGIELEGVGRWEAGKISLRNRAELFVRAGAELRMEAGDTLEWTPASVSGSLRVEGHVVASFNSGVTTVTVPMLNDGEIWIESGATWRTVNSSDVSGSGDWWIDTGALLDLSSSSMTVFGAGGSVTGGGTLRTASGVVSVEGGLDVGRLEALANTLSLSSGGLLEVGTLEQTDGRISFSNGTVLRVSDAWSWGERGMAGEGTLHIATGAVATVSTASSFRGVDAGSQVVVDGTLRWTTGQIGLRNGGDLHVRAGGLVEILGDVSLTSVNTEGPDAEPLFLNEGTVLKSGGTGTTVIAADLRNRGVVTLGAGRILHAGAVWHEAGSVLQGAGTFDIQQAGELAFDGRTNPGRLPEVSVGEPTPALLSFFGGSVTFGPEHRLDLQLSGTALADHDRVTVGGVFTAGGELRITGFGDWVPQPGEQLTVMQFTSRSGTFDEVTGLDFGLALGGVALDTVWMSDRLLLVGQEAPPTVTSGALYGVDATTDALHRIDPVAGTSVRIGTTLGGAATPVGMAVVPSTGELLVWNNSPSHELLTVDVCTGVGTSLQAYSGLDAVQAIAYRADGSLFGFTQDGMFRIDTDAPSRPLTWIDETLGVRVAGADFTPDDRLYGLELRTGAPIRLVELDPASGAILQSMDIRDAEGTLLDVGIAGSLTWNTSTGRFLASSTRGFAGIGTALYDLGANGVAYDPRPYIGDGLQGIGFRPEPTCGG